MNTFQTLTALVVLIFVLSVIVQAVQEVVKALLNTKADVMEQMIVKFMGTHLTLPQVKNALDVRGLDVTALEDFNKDDFRKLLDAVPFEQPQLQGIVADKQATESQAKENIAASYEAARAWFQRMYTRKNKIFAVILSGLVVAILNANPIALYEQIASDQAAQQAIVGKANTVSTASGGGATSTNLGDVYAASRKQIASTLQGFPVLVRTSRYRDDFKDRPARQVLALLFMALLVSMGAPFWNDILKGMMGLNNALNSKSDGTT